MKLRRRAFELARWCASRFGPRSGVLLYHRVAYDDLDPFRLCVSPERFEEQLHCLARSGGARSLPELVEQARRGKVEPGTVSVTFDDGYLDVFENALPLLEKHGVPATVFVTTGNLGKRFWWDRLASIIHGAEVIPSPLRIDAGGAGISLHPEKAGRGEVFSRLYPVFQNSLPSRREDLLLSLARTLRVEEPVSGSRCMSPDEVRELSRHPLITVGAHTVTHCRLASLPYRDQLIEIESSAGRLTEITGTQVSLFSYPFGLRGRDYNDDTLRATAAANMDTGFAADRGALTASTPCFEIPRLWIHDFPPSAFDRYIRCWTGNAPGAPEGNRVPSRNLPVT